VKLGTWIGATKALLATDNTDRLKKLTVSTLVIWGVQDNIFLNDPDQTAIKNVLRQAASRQAPMFWKQYGSRPLPASGMQEDDIGHNVQWGAPEEVAGDIESFMRDGRPLPGLPRADAPAHLHRIVVDQNAALIEQWP
jgi:pimeloyl-ACP methyl ester carboxylesterase